MNNTVKRINPGHVTVVLLKLLAIALFASAEASDFQAGVEAYNRGDFAAALREWVPLAEQGDASARFNLGVMYESGKGIPRDNAEAVKWYRKAAERGLAAAQNRLGLMYAEGKGVPSDNLEAYAWFNIAAAQGDENAAKNRQLITESITREEIVRAQQLAREYWNKDVLPFRN